MNIKKLALHITLVFLPILVGCMPINRQQTTPTDTFSGTPSYSTTSMLTDFSPTVTTTSPTPPVTDTASSGDINWAEGIRPVFSSPYLRIYATHRNLWSPTSNEILIDCHEERTHIVTLGAPDFETVVLANDSGCWDAAWSPDGMSVAYVNGANDILIATPKTGEAFRANKRNSLRIPINLSWIDSQKLIYGEYMGGGHVNFREFDILSGEEYDIAQVPGGDLDTPFSGYLPITFETFVLEKHVLMISRRLPESNALLPHYLASGRYLPFPPFDGTPNDQALTEFNGWLPNSKQALIEWRDIGTSGNVINKETLMLWDVEVDQVSILAPDAIQGKISWDGKYLAYLTRGPAALSDDRTPIEKSDLYPINLDDLLHDNPIYLQLLDMVNKKVIFSIASNNMDFSPNGHYLTFAAKEHVQIDDEGILVADNSKSELCDYLHVFDLDTLKIAHSLKDTLALPIWSPTGDQFLYVDIFENVNLYDMNDAKTMPITQKIGKYKVKQMEWSFDSQYFYILLSEESEEFEKLVILKNILN